MKQGRKSEGVEEAELVSKRIGESGRLLTAFSSDKDSVRQVVQIALKIVEAFRKGRRVLIFGNGGSAADAQHFAGELVGGYTNHARRPLDVTALSTNTSNLTAIGNDYSYEEVFSRQVEAHARAGDVVIGISTSGNSANVIRAMETAKKIGALTIGMTGHKGGKLVGLGNITLCANSNSTPRIQEVHISAIHAICELIEKALFSSSTSFD